MVPASEVRGAGAGERDGEGTRCPPQGAAPPSVSAGRASEGTPPTRPCFLTTLPASQAPPHLPTHRVSASRPPALSLGSSVPSHPVWACRFYFRLRERLSPGAWPLLSTPYQACPVPCAARASEPRAGPQAPSPGRQADETAALGFRPCSLPSLSFPTRSAAPRLPLSPPSCLAVPPLPPGSAGLFAHPEG